MDIKKAAEEYEKLVKSNSISFSASDLSKLAGLPALMVVTVLLDNGIEWELGDRKVGDFLCFRIQDEKARYLIVGKEHFMWCTEGMDTSIHPDEFLVYLFDKYRNTKVKIMQDRTAILEDRGEKVYVPHPK